MSANSSDRDGLLFVVSTTECDFFSTIPAECIGEHRVRKMWRQGYLQTDDKKDNSYDINTRRNRQTQEIYEEYEGKMVTGRTRISEKLLLLLLLLILNI
jgi:hypothetical protein